MPITVRFGIARILRRDRNPGVGFGATPEGREAEEMSEVETLGILDEIQALVSDKLQVVRLQTHPLPLPPTQFIRPQESLAIAA